MVLSNASNRKLLLGKKDRSSAGRTRKASLFSDTPRVYTKVDPGRRVAQILDEHTQRLGLTWWLTAAGDLFLGRPTYDQEPSFGFYCYSPGSKNVRLNNCELTVRRSMDERFSEIVIAGQGSAASGNILQKVTKSAPSTFKARATDPDLKARGIERRQIISDSDVLNRQQAQHRADWEMGRRRLSGLKVTVTARGLRQGDRLFAIDTIARVVVEEEAIDDLMWVAQRRFQVDRNGERTTLTLYPRGWWLP